MATDKTIAISTRIDVTDHNSLLILLEFAYNHDNSIVNNIEKPIININDPNTNAVMYQRLSIIAFRRSRKPVAGPLVCSSVGLDLNKSIRLLLLVGYVLLVLPS